jgi:hypothetical protein
MYADPCKNVADHNISQSLFNKAIWSAIDIYWAPEVLKVE